MCVMRQRRIVIRRVGHPAAATVHLAPRQQHLEHPVLALSVLRLRHRSDCTRLRMLSTGSEVKQRELTVQLIECQSGEQPGVAALPRPASVTVGAHHIALRYFLQESCARPANHLRNVGEFDFAGSMIEVQRFGESRVEPAAQRVFAATRQLDRRDLLTDSAVTTDTAAGCAELAIVLRRSTPVVVAHLALR